MVLVMRLLLLGLLLQGNLGAELLLRQQLKVGAGEGRQEEHQQEIGMALFKENMVGIGG